MIHVPGGSRDPKSPTARDKATHPTVKLLHEKHGASIISCIATLSNTNVGVAVLALPAAFADAGLVGGALMLLAAGGAAVFSAGLLAECVDAVGRPATLASVAKAGLGPLRVLSDLAILIGSSGCAVGYLIVVGDTIPHVMAHAFGVRGVARQVYILASLCVIVPLAYLRKIDSLRYASFFVMVCSAYVMALMAVYISKPSLFGSPNQSCMGPVDGVSDTWHTLVALPTFAFSYAWQAQAAPIASELRNPTRARVTTVFVGAWAVVTSIFVVVGFGGYLSFGRNVKGDLLLCYPDTLEVATIRLAFAYIVVFSHPVISYPISFSVDSLLDACSCGTLTASADDTNSSSLFVTDKRRAAIIGVYLIVTVAIALSVEDLGLIISLSGAVASALIVFVVPGFCYLNLVKSGPPFRRALALLCALAGLVLLPLLAYVVLKESANEAALAGAAEGTAEVAAETASGGGEGVGFN